MSLAQVLMEARERLKTVTEEEEKDEFESDDGNAKITQTVDTPIDVDTMADLVDLSDKEGDPDYTFSDASDDEQANKKLVNEAKGKLPPWLKKKAGKKLKEEDDKKSDDDEDEKKTAKKVEESTKDDEKEEVAEGVIRKKISALKLKNEDVKAANQVQDLFKEETGLSAEFIQKATNLFETAIAVETNKRIDEVGKLVVEDYKKMRDRLESKVNRNVSKYLSVVVEDWKTENKKALKKTARAEIAESVLKGVLKVFEENYIKLDESKVNIVEALNKKIGEVSAYNKRLTKRYADLKEQNEYLLKQKIIMESHKDLTDNDREKLLSLSEAIDFNDEDSFKDTVKGLRSLYIGKKPLTEGTTKTNEFDTTSEVEMLTEENSNSSNFMDSYLKKYGGSNR